MNLACNQIISTSRCNVFKLVGAEIVEQILLELGSRLLTAKISGASDILCRFPWLR